ncbi:hypothetical protein AB5J72_24425 [Streptomyces sp. CG1]|uniref:hypothetical protein n=1 Tax=Streptomyces sp. CG1 TaxID=1287523 RepID=UPI0034E206C6
MIPLIVLHALKAPAASGAKCALSKLFGLEAEQAKTLNRIETKIDASLQSSYNQGLIYLQDAISETDSMPRQRDYLEKAESRLIEAVANFETIDPMRSAWAAIYLTMICKINDNSAGAGRWALRAYRASVSGVQQQCELINRSIDTQIGKRLKVTGKGSSALTGVAAGAFWPVGIPAWVSINIYRKHRIREGRATLTELDQFSDQLQEAAVLLTGQRVPGYFLDFNDGTGRFTYTRPIVVDSGPAPLE